MIHNAYSITECAENEPNCWECGKTCVARLDDKGKLSVQGSGAIYNYGRIHPRGCTLYSCYVTAAPWNTQIENIKSIEIGEGITSVGTFAFANVSKATTINIAKSVERIEEGGFDRCHALTSVNFPEDSKLKYIGRSAFYWTENLTKIKIPDSVETITWSFGGTTSLREIIMSDKNIALNTIFYNYNGVPFDSKNITLKCKGDLEKCKENLKKYGLLNSFADIIPYSCAKGMVMYKDECLDEYPFAKKHWTPAEAAQWLNEDNNTITLTFKK